MYRMQTFLLSPFPQLCHMPHLMAELYVNFDCGLYSSNVFENITKLLSKVPYIYLELHVVCDVSVRVHAPMLEVCYYYIIFCFL